MNRIMSLFPLSLLLAMVAGVLAAPLPAVAAPAATRFACDGADAAGKGWVLPVYVYQPGQDAYGADAASLINAMWETDQAFDVSAHRFGVSRRIRLVQDDRCRPVVAKIPFVKGRNRAEMGRALEENLAAQPALVRELWPTKRVKALFFVRDNDITGSCTGGGADAGLSNGGAILPRWCWSEAGLTHEFLHSFGLSHCGQSGTGPNGDDPLCRNWGSRPECTSDAASNYHLDSCRSDEFRYFEPTPVRQPPLAKNRNVAFSPYLIQDQPSSVWEFRMKAVESGKCLDGSGQQVVLRACGDGRQQLWRRAADADGYLTLSNAQTGRCLTMPATAAAPVVTGACAGRREDQQWLPKADQDKTNFGSRTGGQLGVTAAGDGTPVVRDGKGTFVAEPLGGTPAPAPTEKPTGSPSARPTGSPSAGPTTSPAPTATPTPTRSGPTGDPSTPDPEPEATRPGDPATSPARRDTRFRTSSGACLAVSGPRVRLGSCRTAWRAVPVSGGAVQLRNKGRCLTAAKRSLVVSACARTSTRQRWLLEKRPGGSLTLKLAGTRATRLVASGARVYVKAAYARTATRFTVR
ncbi:ricin-type beta-trefoil lectin domain protein [Nonomuraea sp. NBC_01738]|uniref:ricin-type beta-trefoil lectin domain protein n=1 Tax=Nonomuraea sp. NBC_01738 TaxID=2976003 RepID=UPI002E12D943|nr:ricin-type beta-trefoil lectin domain protein [Nonomuraea sp. NBC_01738]